jgi:hypothetical protein
MMTIESQRRSEVMRIIRLVGLVFVAVVAMSVAVVSSASAFSSNPLFAPANKQSVTGEQTTKSTLEADGLAISCTSNHVISGVVSNALLIGGVVIHYLGCTWVKGEKESGCQASSTGAPSGLILTNTLHGILGLLLPQNDTGILFLPVSGSTFVTFAAAEIGGKSCGIQTAVQGSVAALITPVGTPSTTGTVTIVSAKEINEIDLTHGLGLVKAKLVAFGGEASKLTQTDAVTFGELTEVT